jgi:hypothetical protein
MNSSLTEDEKPPFQIFFMNYPRRIPRPVDGDECGAGAWGCNPPPQFFLMMPRPVGG